MQSGLYSVALVLAAFLLNALSCGISYTFGLYYIEFLEVFKEGSVVTSWIGSINYAVQCGTGPMASVLANHIGIRWTTILGGLVTALGLFITAFANNIYVVIASLGVITGVGFGLVFTMGTVAVAVQFDAKYRPIALILSQSGISIGAFLYPFLCEYLLDTYSWRGTMIITSALTLNMVAAGAVIRTELPKSEKDVGRPSHHSMWLSWKYWLMHAHSFFIYFGTIAFSNHISSYSESLGHRYSLSVKLISVHAISGLFTRCLVSLLVKFMDPCWLLSIVTLIPALGQFLITIYGSYISLCIGSVLHSFVFCALGPVFLEALMRFLGPKDFALGYGCLEVSMAAGALLGPPAAGFIYEETGVYQHAFYFTGSSLALAAMCVAFLNCDPSKAPKDVIVVDEVKADVEEGV
ncbi:hypothetical protein CAPTEDRAFT_179028 [Capitella teleta]|uniref:Major facilitator superfamily (MFS) profile domain-containing protein n=1 Tax=Capitella teleta TaxID=283909 RepID=R7TYW6_CAPTE|nr:hypothetical protein CAPTEDRAFT_179028 [Capitella teleta]|eukprot:ELT96150.1 hypothetical protein CAPTEDRAFT_179028 [Capitella teleta]